MIDIVDKSTRSRMMAGIKGKNTNPELLIRSGLHARGSRFRLHGRKLPGKPDIVFPKYNALILINGCFWHLHDCHLFKWPKTRPAFWKYKLTRNSNRDAETREKLAGMGWRSLTIWECALKGKTKLCLDDLICKVIEWLEGGEKNLEIRGSD